MLKTTKYFISCLVFLQHFHNFLLILENSSTWQISYFGNLLSSNFSFSLKSTVFEVQKFIVSIFIFSWSDNCFLIGTFWERRRDNLLLSTLAQWIIVCVGKHGNNYNVYKIIEIKAKVLQILLDKHYPMSQHVNIYFIFE